MSRSADGSSADDDPVRSSPPEDPWLTEAPTSAFPESPAPGPAPLADTTPLADTAPLPDAAHSGTAPLADPVPHADTAPFPDPVPHAGGAWSGGAPPFDEPPPPDRRDRRPFRWVVAILAVCALFIGGLLAWDQFGSDGDKDALEPPPTAAQTPPLTAAQTPAPTAARTRSTTPAVGEPVVTASSLPEGSASASAPTTGGPLVIYEVTASGSGNTGSVSYTDQDGDIIRRNGIKLPWRVTFRLGGQRKPPLVLISQRLGGGDAGPVTCSITLDGKVLSSTTAEGRYAAPQCSG